MKKRLDRAKEATKRSKCRNEWQIGEVQAAIEEADAGDFASAADVAALARKRNAKAAPLNADAPKRS